jgi:hypothetical protein
MHKKPALILFSRVGALALSFTSLFQVEVAIASWRPYGNTNPIRSSTSTWECGITYPLATGVGAQVCIVRTPDRKSTQGAIIVQNRSSSLYSASAGVSVYREDTSSMGSWECSRSGVAANSWSVCFGDTIRAITSYDNYTYRATGYVNMTDLGFSPLL